MKKLVPLKKDINFKTNLAEITSIALDHELKLVDRQVLGNLYISGSYKINDVSVNTEEFKYTIPVNIEISDQYVLDELKINIDDFYYEIIDNSVLSVSVDVALDNIKEEKLEHPIILDDEIKEAIRPMTDLEKDYKKVTNEKNLERIEVDSVKSLFDSFDESTESYSTYKVCIVKETDTVESIIIKYGITKEILEEYNDINDIKIGDKLIIPSVYEKNQ